MSSPLRKVALVVPAMILLTLAVSGQGGAPNPPANKPGNKSNGAAATKWCQQNTSVLHDIYDWISAHKGQKPDLPPPPPTVPDCSECGREGHHTPNQDKIDAYIKKVGEPEMTYVSQLLNIEHQMYVIFGSPVDITRVPNNLGYCAFYLDGKRMDDDVRWLMDRVLLQKVIPSVEKYQGVREDILALFQLIPYYCKAYAGIVGYEHGNVGGVAGYQSLDDDRYKNLERASDKEGDLFKTYYDYFIRQLYEKYQYSLYPSLMDISRQLLLMGYHNDKLENDVYGYINQGISFMHFKMKIEFEETGPLYHYKLKGEKIVRCKLLPDTVNTCYSFEPEDGKGFPLKLDDISIQYPQVTVDYTGPKEVENAFIIRMNLCEGSPVFHLVFTEFGLQGTIVIHSPAGDVTSGTPFHPGGYFMPDLATAEDRKDQQEKYAAGFKANMDKYKSAMMDWAAHRGDKNYATTPQGKKDMALIMQFQNQTGMKTPFLNGVQGIQTSAGALPTGNNKLFTFDMPLHFSKQAIDYEHDATLGDKIHYHAHVTLEETPDDRDNIKPPVAGK
jgi:hypothetical protein